MTLLSGFGFTVHLIKAIDLTYIEVTVLRDCIWDFGRFPVLTLLPLMVIFLSWTSTEPSTSYCKKSIRSELNRKPRAWLGFPCVYQRFLFKVSTHYQLWGAALSLAVQQTRHALKAKQFPLSLSLLLFFSCFEVFTTNFKSWFTRVVAFLQFSQNSNKPLFNLYATEVGKPLVSESHYMTKGI